jgi:hypothetical protein
MLELGLVVESLIRFMGGLVVKVSSLPRFEFVAGLSCFVVNGVASPIAKDPIGIIGTFD